MSHQVVADVLIDTLTNVGWRDDADELIADMLEHDGIEQTIERVREIQIAMEFVKDNVTVVDLHYGDLDNLNEVLDDAIDRY